MSAMGVGDEFDLAGKRVWVAGHRGMVGSALVRRLADEACDLVTVDRDEVDLRDQEAVDRWVGRARPDAVFVAAGTVGGIEANRTRPAEFLYDNLAIAANVVHAAATHGVAKLMYLGSSCVYPRLADQPVTEDSLLTGPFEATNEWYAVAKVSGLKLCQAYRQQYGHDFIAVVPTNLYGPGDTFDLASGHVIAALMRKIDSAKATGGAVEVWGTGRPRREFMYVDDAADGLVFLMRRYSGPDIVNLAGGDDISVADLAKLIADVVGFDGPFRFDETKPDGTPFKSLDAGRLRALGWRAATPLRDGLVQTYRWWQDSRERQRAVAETGIA
jgi:GDP-L-fucose synthase